jgi:hypothetical protein
MVESRRVKTGKDWSMKSSKQGFFSKFPSIRVSKLCGENIFKTSEQVKKLYEPVSS